MIKVNCAALPATLIESELFGREKGAFTGALARQAGRFEIADGSTIFLDEIGELPLELQPKLLRVLARRRIRASGRLADDQGRCRVSLPQRTGRSRKRLVRENSGRTCSTGSTCFRSNCRRCANGARTFRCCHGPSSRNSAIRWANRSMKIAGNSMAAMLDYHWPGNIRELRNVIERAMILSHSPRLCIKLAHANLRPVSLAVTAGSLDEAERAIILQALEQCNWRIRGSNGAATVLDIKPTTLNPASRSWGSNPAGDLRIFGDSGCAGSCLDVEQRIPRTFFLHRFSLVLEYPASSQPFVFEWLICPSDQISAFPKYLSSPFRKNILVFGIRKSVYIPGRPVPQRGGSRSSRNAGRDAVDVDVPITNGTEADGEVVWSRHPDAGVRSAERSVDEGG